MSLYPRNGSSTQNGQIRGARQAPIDLGDSERIEACYWESPVTDSATVRVGYQKPRIVDRDGTERAYYSLKLRHAMADIEATYRVCERALERHQAGEIVLCETDRQTAERVVQTLQSDFGDPLGVALQHLAFDPEELSRLLIKAD